MAIRQKWSPEPWRWSKSAFALLEDANGYVISWNTRPQTEGLANTDRIIVCVNACAGMREPETQIQALQHKSDLWEALFFVRHHPGCGFGEIATALSIDLEYAVELSAKLLADGMVSQREVPAWEDLKEEKQVWGPNLQRKIKDILERYLSTLNVDLEEAETLGDSTVSLLAELDFVGKLLAELEEK